MRTLCTAIFLIYSSWLFSQTSTSTIDKLHTEKDIEVLYHSLSGKHKDLTVHTLPSLLDSCKNKKLVNRVIDSLSISKTFIKNDFDKNGFTDVVFAGYRNTKQNRRLEYLTAIMDYGNDSLKNMDINPQSFEGCALPVSRNDSVLDVFFENFTLGYRGSIRNILKKQAVIYKYGSFIEFSSQVKPHKIGSLSLEHYLGHPYWPTSKICLNESRKAHYTRYKSYRETNLEFDIQEKLISDIDTSAHKEIWELVHYLDLPNLKGFLSGKEVFDDSFKMSIRYSNGMETHITGIDRESSPGIFKLYNYLSKLKGTQKWEAD